MFKKNCRLVLTKAKWSCALFALLSFDFLSWFPHRSFQNITNSRNSTDFFSLVSSTPWQKINLLDRLWSEILKYSKIQNICGQHILSYYLFYWRSHLSTFFTTDGQYVYAVRHPSRKCIAEVFHDSHWLSGHKTMIIYSQLNLELVIHSWTLLFMLLWSTPQDNSTSIIIRYAN